MQISYDEGNVVLTEVRDFDLAQTLECGQCFHFKKLAEQEYAVCAFHRLLRIRQEKDSVILFDTAMQDYEMIWRDYFDFGRDYGRIKAALLQTDDTLKEAVETMQGVHILQQEFFETLISFIISQNKQIPHIKKIVETLSERFGDDLGEINGMRFFAFPDVQCHGRRPAGLQNGLPSAVYCRCGAENGRRTDIGGCIKSGGYRRM